MGRARNFFKKLTKDLEDPIDIYLRSNDFPEVRKAHEMTLDDKQQSRELLELIR